MYMEHNLQRELARVLGKHSISRDSAEISSAQTATFATNHSILGIIRPGSRMEVQECVRLANEFRVPIFTVSTGKNWGYGSRVPNADGCLLMELGRLNRICDFNEHLAYVTLEPGVTQQQLYNFLQEKKARLWMDATGSTPGSSVIGNTVERGFGHTPYGDHFANACALEVVLPNGDCIETGFGRYPGANAAPVYRWGTGPTLDGLFSQSNLGIVTRMTVWLMPAPEHFEAFFFRCERESDLGPLLEALRPLRMNGTLRSSVHIANGYKVISSMGKYPWDRTGNQTPLTPAVLDRLSEELNFGKWNGSGGLYGTKVQVNEAKRLLRKGLSGKVSALKFLNDRKLGMAQRWAGPFHKLTKWDLSRTLELVKPVYGLMKGIPTEHPLRSAYWRKRGEIPKDMDPDRDRCGLIWCAPIAPFEGNHALAVAEIATRVLLNSGFEPMLSITLVADRALACVITIAYDRDVLGEDERAMACHHELVRELTTAGYHFYRLGVQSMAEMGGPSAYTATLERIRQSLDPNDIMSPGRYFPGHTKAKHAVTKMSLS